MICERNFCSHFHRLRCIALKWANYSVSITWYNVSFVHLFHGMKDGQTKTPCHLDDKCIYIEYNFNKHTNIYQHLRAEVWFYCCKSNHCNWFAIRLWRIYITVSDDATLHSSFFFDWIIWICNRLYCWTRPTLWTLNIAQWNNTIHITKLVHNKLHIHTAQFISYAQFSETKWSWNPCL